MSPHSQVGRPALSAEERELRRRAIIAQVGSLLRARPYREISVQEIADHCGISKGTFYYYFKTKEEVFWDALLQNLQDLTFELIMLMKHLSGQINTPLFIFCLTQLYGAYWHTIRSLPLLHTELSASVGIERVEAFHFQLIQIRDILAKPIYEHFGIFANENEAQLFVYGLYREVVGISAVHEAFLLPGVCAAKDPIFEQVMSLFASKIILLKAQD